MKLSVIVPSLTGQLPESLRRQTEGRDDVEVVVVTGVSPVGRARNEGLDRVRGEYIAWVDSDDEVTDEWLAEILKAIDHDHPDVLTFDAELVGWRHWGDCVWGVRGREISVPRLLRDICRDICRPSNLWLYVVRRELWRGLRFDEHALAGEDFLLLPQVLKNATSCTYIPKRLYRYVCNEKGLTNTQGPKRERDILNFRIARIDAVPASCRGAALWGAAVSCYWICDRNACGSDDIGRSLEELAQDCRAFVCRHSLGLLREALVSHDLSVRDRVGWLLRFMCVAVDVWWFQRLRHVI